MTVTRSLTPIERDMFYKCKNQTQTVLRKNQEKVSYSCFRN